MKRLLILLAIAPAAYGALANLVVGPGPLTATGTFVEHTVAVAADDATPTVALGNTFITGINTGATAITDLDDPTAGATYTIVCGSIAGGFQSTIADAGNFTLDGAWNPATVGDSITLYCRADNDYVEVARAYAVAGPREGDPFLAGPDAVGAPGHSWGGDPNTGIRNSAANVISVVCDGADVGAFDATGYDGAIGFTAPAAAVFTTVQGTDATFTGDVAGGEDLSFGQTPADQFLGYKARGDYITYINTFDEGTDTELADQWDIATLIQGGGSTVTELTTDGWVTLATGGAGGPDSAGIRTNGLNHFAAYAPRIECVVDLGTVAAGSNNFYFGFYAAANRFVEIIFEPATSANWLLRVDDTLGAETEDSGVAATVNPTKLEIAITAGGVVSWAIDDVAMPVTGITNLMANAHYARAYLLDVAAAAHTAEIDYYISEQLRQQ